jgi:hypothetical protein
MSESRSFNESLKIFFVIGFLIIVVIAMITVKRPTISREQKIQMLKDKLIKEGRMSPEGKLTNVEKDNK